MPISFANNFNNHNWELPQMRTMWNNFNNYNWSTMPTVWNNFSYTPSAPVSGSSETSEAQKREQVRKQIEQNLKKREENEKNIQELQEKLKTFNEGIVDETGKLNTDLSRKNVEEQYKLLEKGKAKENGSVAVYEKELKSMSLSSKIGRGLMNGLTGIGNLCKSLVGYDKDGKWNPKKCLLNAAIAGAAVGLCCTGICAPIGAALAASLGGGAAATFIGTTVASIPAILTTSGIVTGAVQVVKGAVDTASAKTLEEFDNATQNIGMGTCIGVSSVMGLKGISKGTGLTGLANLNPFKIGRAQMNTAYNAMTVTTGTNTASINTSTPNIVKANLWGKINTGRKAVLMMGAADADMTFNNKLVDAKNKLTSQIDDIKTNIRQATDNKTKALLKIKQQYLQKNLDRLDSANSYTDWKNLTKNTVDGIEEYKNYLNQLDSSGSVRINRYRFNANTRSDLEATIKSLTKQQKDILKLFKDVKTLRLQSMKQMANHKYYSGEVESFGYNKSYNLNIWAKIKNAWRTFRGTHDTKGSMTTGIAGKAFNYSFLAIDPAWAAFEVCGPIKPILGNVICYNTPHEMNADKVYEAAEYKQTKEQLLALKKQYDDTEKALKDKITELQNENDKLV